MTRPSQVLELTDHQVTLLRLRTHTHINVTMHFCPRPLQNDQWVSETCGKTHPGQVAYPEKTTNDITVHRAGHAVHLYRAVS